MTVQTFAEFLATRNAHANICAAAMLTPEEMSIDSKRPGWLYRTDEPYYLIQLDTETVGAVVTIDTITQPTLEAAEAALYSLTHDSREVDQFEAIKANFPHYDDILPIVPGFRENSWYKDTCPKMTLNIGEYEAILWCDYRSTNYRELGDEASPQFTLTVGRGENYEELGNTSFATISDRFALDVLSSIYDHYCTTQGLGKMSADELIFEELTADQRTWVSNFIHIWEELEA